MLDSDFIDSPYPKRKLPESNTIMWMGILSTIIIGSILGLFLAIATIFKANATIREYKKHPKIYFEKSYKKVKAGKICAITGLLIRLILIIILVSITN